ncbi:MAG: 3'-5' exonuclease domain-containing protein 2 [Tidjanibacter sp.]|nr:3'-5' exonuclease domain-containing protein 2 [Tidjanibacter sp.]MBQ2247218.1 3'-5' exonuclease domain-containing protein 2 [Tidjanibacter sp.]
MKSTFRHSISPDEIKDLPVAGFEGRVVVVDTTEKLLEACEELAREPIIGFDTETRPSFKQGVSYNVSLIQLSTPTTCYLIRLGAVRMERCLMKILESKKTLKVGVDVQGDIRNLTKIRHFRAGGFVELQKEVEAFGIEDKSLRKMAAIILGVGVSKAQRLSNWEARELTPAQIRYAATDAWICLEMYDRLQASR